jgi:hypothetical protein
LYALGFFSGEVSSLLTLKRTLFEVKTDLYSLNLDLRNYVYREKMVQKFSEAQVGELRYSFDKRAEYLMKNSYIVEKEIFDMKNDEIRKGLKSSLDEPICQAISETKSIEFDCESIRASILKRGIFPYNFRPPNFAYDHCQRLRKDDPRCQPQRLQ